MKLTSGARKIARQSRALDRLLALAKSNPELITPQKKAEIAVLTQRAGREYENGGSQ